MAIKTGFYCVGSLPKTDNKIPLWDSDCVMFVDSHARPPLRDHRASCGGGPAPAPAPDPKIVSRDDDPTGRICHSAASRESVAGYFFFMGAWKRLPINGNK
ncbi:hypothetical protein V6N12_049816 [Hibiscus sabdariffa]|uniref:Uncharacterized protein n=1 Tax=Hibiscus sabdariffa TaxID=183260 RepID=A0ABR2GAW6_9ROSI